jgi:stage II sporulation protein M
MKKRVRNKKGFSLVEQYKKTWDYLRKSQNFIWTIVGIFFAFVLIGFFVPLSEQVSESIFKFLEELVGKTKDMSQGELISFLFLNNVQSSFFGFVFGVVLGIFSIFATALNGFILGFVAAWSVEVAGFSSLWKIFPHGIFELPAVFISLGLGLKFGSFIFQKEVGESFRDYFLNGLRVFFFVVIPLLIVAAIIEGSLIFVFG